MPPSVFQSISPPLARERRAALVQIVDTIEFDPASGTGHIHYRIGLNGGIQRPCRLSRVPPPGGAKPGYVASPREPQALCNQLARPISGRRSRRSLPPG